MEAPIVGFASLDDMFGVIGQGGLKILVARKPAAQTRPSTTSTNRPQKAPTNAARSKAKRIRRKELVIPKYKELYEWGYAKLQNAVNKLNLAPKRSVLTERQHMQALLYFYRKWRTSPAAVINSRKELIPGCVAQASRTDMVLLLEARLPGRIKAKTLDASTEKLRYLTNKYVLQGKPRSRSKSRSPRAAEGTPKYVTEASGESGSAGQVHSPCKSEVNKQPERKDLKSRTIGSTSSQVGAPTMPKAVHISGFEVRALDVRAHDRKAPIQRTGSDEFKRPVNSNEVVRDTAAAVGAASASTVPRAAPCSKKRRVGEHGAACGGTSEPEDASQASATCVASIHSNSRGSATAMAAEGDTSKGAAGGVFKGRAWDILNGAAGETSKGAAGAREAAAASHTASDAGKASIETRPQSGVASAAASSPEADRTRRAMLSPSAAVTIEKRQPSKEISSPSSQSSPRSQLSATASREASGGGSHSPEARLSSKSAFSTIYNPPPLPLRGNWRPRRPNGKFMPAAKGWPGASYSSPEAPPPDSKPRASAARLFKLGIASLTQHNRTGTHGQSVIVDPPSAAGGAKQQTMVEKLLAAKKPKQKRRRKRTRDEMEASDSVSDMRTGAANANRGTGALVVEFGAGAGPTQSARSVGGARGYPGSVDHSARMGSEAGSGAAVRSKRPETGNGDGSDPFAVPPVRLLGQDRFVFGERGPIVTL